MKGYQKPKRYTPRERRHMQLKHRWTQRKRSIPVRHVTPETNQQQQQTMKGKSKQ